MNFWSWQDSLIRQWLLGEIFTDKYILPIVKMIRMKYIWWYVDKEESFSKKIHFYDMQCKKRIWILLYNICRWIENCVHIVYIMIIWCTILMYLIIIYHDDIMIQCYIFIRIIFNFFRTIINQRYWKQRYGSLHIIFIS